MSPSVAQIEQVVSDPIQPQAVKENLKVDEESKTEVVDKGPSYPFYYPYVDPNEKFPPIELFDHVDPGTRADPKKPHLLTPNVKTFNISPYLGTEISGVQLSELTKEGLDELALFAAERKVLVFRDQDFKDLGPDRQIEIAKYFGPIHKYATSDNVKGYPEFHVVYRHADRKIIPYRKYAAISCANYLKWHSDCSFEKQPAGTTFFFILEQPEQGGGDTIFLSQVEAYNRLSPEFQKRLEGLRALHSSVGQVESSKKRNGANRREPVETEHPVVRVHPVTGEKALYINQSFTRYIIGFRQEESDYLLNFLFDHIAKGSDFQIRARYEPGTVVVWDNRVTAHTATPDYSTARRHAVRLTPQAEVPAEA